jgi:hypothetical protein
MNYPLGLRRYVLWGCTLLLCIRLALVYEGHGLVMDWLILSALAIWHMRAMDRRERAIGSH